MVVRLGSLGGVGGVQSEHEGGGQKKCTRFLEGTGRVGSWKWGGQDFLVCGVILGAVKILSKHRGLTVRGVKTGGEHARGSDKRPD